MTEGMTSRYDAVLTFSGMNSETDSIRNKVVSLATECWASFGRCIQDTAFFFRQVGGPTPKAGGRQLDGRT